MSSLTRAVTSPVSGHGGQEGRRLREVDVNPGNVGDDIARPEGIILEIFDLKVNLKAFPKVLSVTRVLSNILYVLSRTYKIEHVCSSTYI